MKLIILFYLVVNTCAFYHEDIWKTALRSLNDMQLKIFRSVTKENNRFSTLHSDKLRGDFNAVSVTSLNLPSQAAENKSSPSLRSSEALNTTIKNGSQLSSTRCDKEILLFNNIKQCGTNNCCILYVYENQFRIESKDDNITTTLEKCKNSCKYKNPPIICNQSTNKNVYNTQLISCYEKCFINENKCKVGYSKVISTVEIVLLVIFLGSFVMCLIRTTILKDCSCEGGTSSSKVHVESTKETFSGV